MPLEKDHLQKSLAGAFDGFIAAVDCVVLPSYREGTPRSLLEAAAMAKPLIATDVPGCRGVVEHELNGFLCPARDPSLPPDCGDFTES